MNVSNLLAVVVVIGLIVAFILVIKEQGKK